MNTIQDLWTKCLYCPLCQETCRSIEVSAGPDRSFRDTSALKYDNTLHIKTYFKLKQLRYRMQYDINCLTNKFEMSIADESDVEMDADKSIEEERICRKVDRSDAYFWLDGNCPKCSSHICSDDIYLKMKYKKLEDISIESETVKVLDQYEVIMHPSRNEMEIGKLDKMSIFIKRFTYPLAELDFSNPQKAIERIETIITFN